MTHYAVLRHQFDVHRNPDRLGPVSNEKFCLTMTPGGEAPSYLVGNTVWLISWEGFMKTHHVTIGWFQVSHVGRRHGVVANHFAGGSQGVLFPRGLGPLDLNEWFHTFVERNPRFREGEPTDLGAFAVELINPTRSAGFPAPELAGPSPAPASAPTPATPSS